MGYSNYRKLKTVVKKFNLQARSVLLFEDVTLIEPSNWLSETLKMSYFFPLTNEKTKAERVVSPILMEVSKSYRHNVAFFSGEDLNIKPEDDLSGECDFFFALHPPQPFIDAPIISIAEAKDEDLEWGTAQCAAQLYGAKLFNETEGKHFPVLYGCTSTGTDWQFIRFENDTFYVDSKIYTDIREILGVWTFILDFYTKN